METEDNLQMAVKQLCYYSLIGEIPGSRVSLDDTSDLPVGYCVSI